MVVLSSILSNDPGCSNPLLGYSNEPVNIVGLNDRLPMVFFLALSIVQIATIWSGHENQIMVRSILKLLFRVEITTNIINFLKLFVWVIFFMYISGQLNRYARIIFLLGIWSGVVEKRYFFRGSNK